MRRLGHLYRRSLPADVFTTPEFAQRLAALSAEIDASLCVYVNRRGQIVRVAVGTPHQTQFAPHELPRQGAERLSGLRCISTQLHTGALPKSALTALAMQRLDALVTLSVSSEGRKRKSAAPTGFVQEIHLAHLVADPMRWSVLRLESLHELASQDLETFIRDLETAFAAQDALRAVDTDLERALLVGVFPPDTQEQALLDEMAELEELVRSAGGQVLDSFWQKRERPHPATFIGEGKVTEVALAAQEQGANLVIFGKDLTPSQARNLEQSIGVRVVDRTQLILDIFARRARSHEGKLQVELAQMEYLLPRLSGSGLGLSRLGGGIGTRGPGETKLETDRRAIRGRIAKLEQQVTRLQAHRSRLRNYRQGKDLPVFALVGYTNAGKSTLLNRLTESEVYVADQLFATLDPTTRRLDLQGGTTVLLTDTVGFVHDLPKPLVNAFRATLEEVTEADFLLHVVDLSNPSWPQHIEAVELILSQMPVVCGPTQLIFNKVDLVTPQELSVALATYPHAVFVSAATGAGISKLQQALRGWAQTETEYARVPDTLLEAAYQ
ncbi:MAG: GTPase HflX [Gloeobacterales cyanobacterium]